jgi:lysosomal alpha-mannosidase
LTIIFLQLHRRCFHDDGYGVNENLDEPGVDGRGLIARGRHWLTLSSTPTAARLHRPLAFELFYAPTLTFAPLTTSITIYRANYNTQVS